MCCYDRFILIIRLRDEINSNVNPIKTLLIYEFSQSIEMKIEDRHNEDMMLSILIFRNEKLNSIRKLNSNNIYIQRLNIDIIYYKVKII